MKMDPKQVHMAPFGLIFLQDGFHKLWEASGMPPGPQNATGKSKHPGFLVCSVFSSISPHFPISPQCGCDCELEVFVGEKSYQVRRPALSAEPAMQVRAVY